MGYSFYRSITVDHTKCGSASSSNFPVLVSGSYSWLASVANGGKVQNASGWDITFTSDVAGLNVLNFEREYWDATGKVVFWVQLPTLSAAADTVIYIWYGNAAVSVDPQNASGAWDSTFAGVWHLGNGSVLSLADSTSHGDTGSNSGATAVAGEISGAANFAGSARVGFGSPAQLTGLSKLTLGFWCQTTTTQAALSTSTVACSKHTGGTNGEYMLSPGYSSPANNELTFVTINASASRVNLSGAIPNAGTYTDGNWHYLVGTYDGSTMALYFDAAFVTSAAQTGSLQSTANNFQLGELSNNGTPGFTGSLDEVRVSNVARSQSWITAEFNNISSPASFYAVGSQQSGGGGALPPRLMLLGCGS